MDVTIECICPPKADGEPRHDHDTVTLREKLDFQTAVLLQKSIQVRSLAIRSKNDATAEIMAFLTGFFIHHGIEAWSVVDDKGKAVDVTDEAITAYLEPNMDAALTVADAGDAAYMEAILPLVRRAYGSSPPSPTNAPSISPSQSGSAKPRKRSRPSSTTTIPTVVTGTIIGSPDGASRFSPSSASVD
jgi:hypothetical protein